jgi:hypothetical protein
MRPCNGDNAGVLSSVFEGPGVGGPMRPMRRFSVTLSTSFRIAPPISSPVMVKQRRRRSVACLANSDCKTSSAAQGSARKQDNRLDRSQIALLPRRLTCIGSRGRHAMNETLVLIAITGAFVIFAGVLLWGDIRTRNLKR